MSLLVSTETSLRPLVGHTKHTEHVPEDVLAQVNIHVWNTVRRTFAYPAEQSISSCNSATLFRTGRCVKRFQLQAVGRTPIRREAAIAMMPARILARNAKK
jgi:hypothetical protein